MSSINNNNMMTTITKNPLITGIVVVFVFIIVILIIVKMRQTNDNTPTPTPIKETFSYSYNDENDIVENFPQSVPMNVMYSDANGNLGTTTDLGLQNLTVNGDSSVTGTLTMGNGKVSTNGSLVLGNKFRFNANKDAHADDDWLRMMNPENTGYSGGFAAGKLYGGSLIHSDGTMYSRGTISAGGDISAGGKISTSTGYGMIDNRNIKPNQLAGHNVQFGFGSMANNGSAPFADTIHLNGWGDASGQRPNLVMFDKSKPGMRIYQADWNSGTAYSGYNDAVMADSGGNASIGGALSAGSVNTGSVNIYNYGDVKTKLEELFRLMPLTINFVGPDTDHSYENRTLSFIQDSVALMCWANGGDGNYNHRIGMLSQRGRDLGFGSSWARHMNDLRNCRTVTMNIPPGKMVKIWTWDDDAPRVFKAGIHSAKSVAGSAGAGIHMIWVGNESRANDIPDSLRMVNGFRF